MSTPDNKIINPQDLDDAIELAFWGVDFDELDPKEAPFELDENDPVKIKSYISRSKSGHDVNKGCFALITHCVVDLVDEERGYKEQGKILFVQWDDGESLFYDITDSLAGALVGESEIGFEQIHTNEINAFRYCVKMALASVTSIE